MRTVPISAAFALGTMALAASGCVPAPEPAEPFAANQAISGYAYSDPNHPNELAPSTPQAQYNARRNTYLWPPTLNGGDLAPR